jgi:hypothetical protein
MRHSRRHLSEEFASSVSANGQNNAKWLIEATQTRKAVDVIGLFRSRGG